MVRRFLMSAEVLFHCEAHQLDNESEEEFRELMVDAMDEIEQPPQFIITKMDFSEWTIDWSYHGRQQDDG